MSKRALKRVRKALGLPVCREPLPAWAWPGGYQLFYLFADGGVCCPDCANKEIALIDEEMQEKIRFPRQPRCGGWALAGVDVYWEGAAMQCDNCNKPIESAYGDATSNANGDR